MEYNIKEQIDTWQKKLHHYEQKETVLRERIEQNEGLRQEVDKMPVGDPRIDKFYRHLSNLYSQLATLPTKIRHCKDKILTLQCEL